MNDEKHPILCVLILDVHIGQYAHYPEGTAMDWHFLPKKSTIQLISYWVDMIDVWLLINFGNKNFSLFFYYFII